jgi:hypothetical protein
MNPEQRAAVRAPVLWMRFMATQLRRGRSVAGAYDAGIAAGLCPVTQSIFARPVAEGVRVARVVRPACWCADCFCAIFIGNQQRGLRARKHSKNQLVQTSLPD